MAIFKSSYSTTLGKQYLTDTVISAIEKGVASNYLSKNTDSFTIVDPESANTSVIPDFSHPVYIEKGEAEGVYVDVRPFVVYDRMQHTTKINSINDYKLLLARAGLEHVWINQPVVVLRDISLVPVSVMASWISENIAKRFPLEPMEQYRLTIFSAFYYYSLFTNDKQKNESEFLRICQSIAKGTRISVQDVIDALTDEDWITDISDFCARLPGFVDSIRLDKFNPALLYTILGGSWFGANAKQIIAISLEHPPTFFAMLLAAATEKLYRRSALSMLLDRVPEKKNVQHFVLDVSSILKVR